MPRKLSLLMELWFAYTQRRNSSPSAADFVSKYRAITCASKLQLCIGRGKSLRTSGILYFVTASCNSASASAQSEHCKSSKATSATRDPAGGRSALVSPARMADGVTRNRTTSKASIEVRRRFIATRIPALLSLWPLIIDEPHTPCTSPKAIPHCYVFGPSIEKGHPERSEGPPLRSDFQYRLRSFNQPSILLCLSVRFAFRTSAQKRETRFVSAPRCDSKGGLLYAS